MSLPNLFLFAAPRSGSTQLSRWLSTHAEIGLSNVKEPNFFSEHEFPEDYVIATHLNDVPPDGAPDRPAQFAVFRSLPAYQDLFAPLKTRWRLDASTSYLACPDAPNRLADLVPDAKIITLTRDPVARAVSHFRLAHRTGRTSATLDQELDRELLGTDPLAARYLLRPSRQQEGGARVKAAFPASQILSITFEEMVANPAQTLSRVADFLDIEDEFDRALTAKNAAALPRFAKTNALLLRLGLKTKIRRWLPVPLRPLARRFWFRDGAAPVTSSEVERLRTLLEAA